MPDKVAKVCVTFCPPSEGFFLQEGCLGLCGHRSLMSECCVSPTLLTTRCNLLWGLFLRSAWHVPITEACRSDEKGLGWLGMQRMRRTLMASCYGIGRLCALSISVAFGGPWHDASPVPATTPFVAQGCGLEVWVCFSLPPSRTLVPVEQPGNAE